MKDLIFIELWDIDDSEINILKRHLYYVGVTKERLEAMSLVDSFNNMDETLQMKLLLDSKNAIVTYSMYVDESLGHLFYFLEFIGKHNLKGLTYIDGSGALYPSLFDYRDGYFTTDNEFVARAIENNNILTLIYDDSLLRENYNKWSLYPHKIHCSVKDKVLVPSLSEKIIDLNDFI